VTGLSRQPDARTVHATAVAAGTCFHAFVFAIYPALVVLNLNAGVLPLNPWAVGRTLAISVLLVAAALLLLKPLLPALRDRAFWISCVLIGFNLYPALSPTTADGTQAAVYATAGLAAATLFTRFAILRESRVGALNLAAGALLAVNVFSSVSAVAASQPWRAEADRLIRDVVATGSTRRVATPPDIYYIVLDGFARPDVLAELYGLDLSPVVRQLESHGFVVPAAARSNYAQTYLSLASSLNMSYLDRLAGGLKESEDRRALDYLIQHNAFFALAKRAGYRIVAIGSDYSATEHFTNVDECRCEQHGMSEFETVVLDRTPLGRLPFDRLTYGAHRRKIAEQFQQLETAADGHTPTLVFAHVIAPHPPFVFDREGRSPRRPAGRFGFMDADQFNGTPAEYVSGYRGQTQFVASRILAVLERILGRPGPSPVIVVQADHGPASLWDWDAAAGDARERLAIFSAYRLPGLDGSGLETDISPVNGLRIVANRYLGTTLPALENRSFTSSWGRPYKLTPVTSERLAPRVSRQTQP
jgi:hypothetical protein